MEKKFSLIVLISICVLINSCRTKDGAPGPAGQSDLINQGSVSGTLSYLDYKGDSVAIPFNYQYYATLQNNQFTYNGINKGNSGYSFAFSRRSINDSNDSISFNLGGSLDSIGRPSAKNTYLSMSFSFIENLNKSVFSFGASDGSMGDSNYGSSYTISNFSLDTLSGQLNFNYVANFGPG